MDNETELRIERLFLELKTTLSKIQGLESVDPLDFYDILSNGVLAKN